jgi:uncharacterized protein
MNLPPHRLSRAAFAALASGTGGPDAVRELTAAEHSKHVILLGGVLDAAQGSDQYQLARSGYDLLAAAWRADRTAAERVIRYPSVGVWARRTIQACRGGPAMPGATPGGMRAVAATAAIHAGLRAEIEVAAVDGWVVLPSLGAARVPGGTAVVRSDKGRAAVGRVEVPERPDEDAPGWMGLRRVRIGSLDILIDDLDPFRMPGAPDLASRGATGPWETAFLQAWPLLERHHPGYAAEIVALISAIVPRSAPLTGTVSTTSSEAFGAVAMSVPPDPVIGAETLAHEVQHLKLAALLDLVTLALPDDGRRYYAPWRDDPRPCGGLIQGAYAFLGVAGFWRQQRTLADGQRRADVEFARWRAAVARAVDTLRSCGRLTPTGQDFMEGMTRTLTRWQADPVPAEAETAARRAAESHLARWRAANGPLPA